MTPAVGPGARVCIVGAGASGLSAAHALAELGYRRITVLEREPRVGGKCCTLIHQGRTYELGAVVLTSAYRSVRALAREVGVRPSLHLGGVRGALRGRGHDGTRRLPDLARTAAGGARFVRELSRHGRIYRPGFAGVSDELALPFDEWCRTNRCEGMHALLAPWVTGLGYGFLDELPAAYVLKYATLFRARFFELPDDGYEGLFRQVAAALEHVDLRLGTRVTQVVREPDGVTVRTTEGTMTCDALVVACPLDEALAFLDASPLEVELFERIRYEPYFVLGASIGGPPFHGRYTFLPDALERARAACARPTLVYRRWPTSDTVFFYGFSPEPDWERAARQGVTSTVERLGGRVHDFVAGRRWRYFPHVQTDDIAGGYYRRLEALQGERRTYYCGEILAFGCVETVAQYSHALVHRYFSGSQSASQAGQGQPDVSSPGRGASGTPPSTRRAERWRPPSPG